MEEYICTACGYVYKPGEGDPDGGVDEGTPFANVSVDWVCPVCNALKKDFEPFEEE